MSDTPYVRVLSLGAGVQSTTVLLLTAEGRLPRLDAAIFSDTGWEPQGVYDHLDRIEHEVAAPAGIPIIRVSNGDIRADSLNPENRYVTVPFFIRHANGEQGIGRRQCTHQYKLKPIKHQIRTMLDSPHPRPVPRGRYAEQWIGISRDEVHRAKDADVAYLRNAFPLLGVGVDTGLVGADGRDGWTRADCIRYLDSRGYGSTPKSACLGCPFRGNRGWREMRDNDPVGWADAVDFDRQIRSGVRPNFVGMPYLHRSLLPLDEAPIDRVTPSEQAALQTDLFGQLADIDAEDGPENGCSPFSCRADGR